MREESKITKRSDLFREYARCIDMCEGTKVYPHECLKWQGQICRNIPTLNDNIDTYEFAIAIVENKPVFKGDVLWTKEGEPRTIVNSDIDSKFIVHDLGICRIDFLTWKEPKRTITINGKEYPAPYNSSQHKSDNVIRFSMPLIEGYYFHTKEDAEDVYKAIVGLLNGK